MEMKSLLQTTQNTRDLGAHATVDGKVTVCNRIYRSDRQEYPSQKDIDFLLARKITTIIDLRTQADTAVKPSGFANLEGFRYFNIPIEEGSTIPESADAVPGSYLRIACAENMRKVFEAIAQAESGVMFNCAAGKDRSGVVAAILLMLCGVQEVEIIADYMLSKEANRERFELLKIKHPEIDMNIVIPRESFMRDFLRLFSERFGTVRNYFAALGLTEDLIARIYGKLLERKEK